MVWEHTWFLGIISRFAVITSVININCKLLYIFWVLHTANSCHHPSSKREQHFDELIMLGTTTTTMKDK